MTSTSDSATEQDVVTARYDRIPRFYDLLDKPMDLFGVWGGRQRLLSRAQGKTLEVGVGTGRNRAVYGIGVDLTGIDLSENMLARARRRAKRLGADAVLERADVQHLAYDDDSFDTVTATCVFARSQTRSRGYGRSRVSCARMGRCYCWNLSVTTTGPLGSWLTAFRRPSAG